MDVVSLFWERQAIWLSRFNVALWIAFALALISGLFVMDSSRALGFILVLVSFWCFGAGLIETLYFRDSNGSSVARKGSQLMRLFVSGFFGIWFVGLLCMTVLVLFKVSS
jgi:hypothetical protein